MRGPIETEARKLISVIIPIYNERDNIVLLHDKLSAELPERILDLPKQGFGIPLRSWLKQWPLPQPSASVPHNSAKLESLRQAHVSGAKDEWLFLWSWLVLQNHLQ